MKARSLLLGPLVTAAALLAPARARAEDAIAAFLGDSVACPYLRLSFHQWTWEDGPQVPFVASHREHDFTALGYDDEGLWAAVVESGDACDVCTSIKLAHYRWSGSVEEVVLVGSPEYERTVSAGHDVGELLRPRLQALVDGAVRGRTVWGRLERLYRRLTLQAVPPLWDPRELRQDYTLRPAPGADADGQLVRYPGWLVAARTPLGGLRVTESVTSHMCWCDATVRVTPG